MRVTAKEILNNISAQNKEEESKYLGFLESVKSSIISAIANEDAQDNVSDILDYLKTNYRSNVPGYIWDRLERDAIAWYKGGKK
jgi:hypothetical protein